MANCGQAYRGLKRWLSGSNSRLGCQSLSKKEKEKEKSFSLSLQITQSFQNPKFNPKYSGRDLMALQLLM